MRTSKGIVDAEWWKRTFQDCQVTKISSGQIRRDDLSALSVLCYSLRMRPVCYIRGHLNSISYLGLHSLKGEPLFEKDSVGVSAERSKNPTGLDMLHSVRRTGARGSVGVV